MQGQPQSAHDQALVGAGALRLRAVFERCGLNWSAVQQELAQGIDTRQAEANREALFAAGLWGAPSFRRGEFTTRGQDRL
ncbi:hypothetical protein [Stagnimonas aquatica]|uniref:hypothetical protein n=1 Tax=Stagnimonas aquatica TaxID=2689987 RepID=UPI000F4593C4|nr:hypothetical protein [Stagnimonas aquatica]